MAEQAQQVDPVQTVPPDQISAAEVLITASLVALAADASGKVLSEQAASNWTQEPVGQWWTLTQVKMARALMPVLTQTVSPVLKKISQRVVRSGVSQALGIPEPAVNGQAVSQVVDSVVDKSLWSLSRGLSAAVDSGSFSRAGAKRMAIGAVTETLARSVSDPFKDEYLAKYQGLQDPNATPEATVYPQVSKTWRTRMDNRVRPTHGGLEGVSVDYDSQFTTFNGDTLRFPGDPMAPPSEVYGCRCRLSLSVTTPQGVRVRSGQVNK